MEELYQFPSHLSPAQLHILLNKIERDFPERYFTLWNKLSHTTQPGSTGAKGDHLRDILQRRERFNNELQTKYEIYLYQDKDLEYLAANPGDEEQIRLHTPVNLRYRAT